LALVCSGLLASVPAFGQNVGWVTPTGASIGCEESTLNDAIAQAEFFSGAGDVINIYGLPGVYVETVVFSLNREYVLEPGDATCLASGPGTININPPIGARTVEVGGATAVVTLDHVDHDGLFGVGPPDGGLIDVVDGSLTLLNNDVRNASATSGGCIRVLGSSLALGSAGLLSTDGTTVHDCAATIWGGGILLIEDVQHPSPVLVVQADSEVYANTADLVGGGGIAVTTGGAASVKDAASVHDNLTPGTGGGGILNSGGDLSVYGSATVHDNSALCTAPCPDPMGGGILSLGGKVFVQDQARVEHNHAAIGGGIAIGGAELVMTDEVAVSENDALHQGGGLALQSSSVGTFAGSPWSMPVAGLPSGAFGLRAMRQAWIQSETGTEGACGSRGGVPRLATT
jgi:hypothetical protein